MEKQGNQHADELIAFAMSLNMQDELLQKPNGAIACFLRDLRERGYSPAAVLRVCQAQGREILAGYSALAEQDQEGFSALGKRLDELYDPEQELCIPPMGVYRNPDVKEPPHDKRLLDQPEGIERADS